TRGRNRHMDIRLKFLQFSMTTEQFHFAYIPSADNDADIGTKVLPLPVFRKLRARVAGDRPDMSVMAMLAQVIPTYRGIDSSNEHFRHDALHTPRNAKRSLTPRRIFSPSPKRSERRPSHRSSSSSSARTRRAGGVSELPKYNVIKYQSPASVATAIDDMADAIVTKATQKAKEAIENAACDNSQTKQQSALE
ncbi:MAG: hypothetical protein VYB01_08585, partial [Pseudomonadota bacterium]|nr:hypothetical protein [Pseudomonadota bacterium]